MQPSASACVISCSRTIIHATSVPCTRLRTEPRGSNGWPAGPMPLATVWSSSVYVSERALRRDLRLEPAVVDLHTALDHFFTAPRDVARCAMTTFVPVSFPTEDFSGRELVALHAGELTDRGYPSLPIAATIHLNDQADRSRDLIAHRPKRQVRAGEQYQGLE